jgi:hypothetical protein
VGDSGYDIRVDQQSHGNIGIRELEVKEVDHETRSVSYKKSM